MTLVSPPIASPDADGAIIRSAQRGEELARNELARKGQRIAFLFALQLTADRDAAMDLAQDALLRFFNSLSRFDPDRPLKPWLLRIVRNLHTDRLRRSRVRRTQQLARDDDDLILEPAADEVGPEELASRHQLQRILWRAVRALPPDHREVIVLRDYHDLSYADIAKVLDVPKGTVMSRLHRARVRLREEVTMAMNDTSGGDHD